MNDHGHDPVCLGGGTDQPCLGSDRCCSPGPDAREDSPSPDPPHEQTSTRVEPHDNGHGDGDGGEETTESPTTKTKTTTTTAKDDGDEITTTKDVASTTKHETTEKPTTTKKPSSTAPRPTSEAEETTTETKTTTRPNTGPTEIMTVAPPVSQATDSPTSVMPTSSIGTLMPTAGNTTSSAAPAPAPGQEDKGVDVTAVAAGVGGAIALMLVLVILGYLIRKRRHSKRMSSTRAESPLPFDDKTGTAEGGALTAPSSLGEAVEPGPVELLSQTHTSAYSASANNRSYRTMPSHASQPQAPPAFRSGSLPSRGYTNQAPSHYPGSHQAEEPLVSPMTPMDYGSHGMPPAAPDYGHAYDQPRRTQSPAQYQLANANTSQQHQARGALTHDQRDPSWPDSSARHHQHSSEMMADVVSPISPDFLASRHPSPPQRPQQAARAPSSYASYRPAASRSSSANSSSYAHAGGHYQGRTHNQAPPPVPHILSQDRMPTGSSRSATPTGLDPRHAAYQREQVPQMPQVPLQGRPRLINIGSSNNIHDLHRATSSASGVELAGNEAASATAPSTIIGQAVSSHSGSGTPRDRRSPDYQMVDNSEHRQPGNGYEPIATSADQSHWPQHGGNGFRLRGDMNATDTERRDDQFVTSWQKL